jgi:hypothetical protein
MISYLQQFPDLYVWVQERNISILEMYGVIDEKSRSYAQRDKKLGKESNDFVKECHLERAVNLFKSMHSTKKELYSALTINNSEQKDYINNDSK